MKENVLDVLMYLFQNYMDDDIDADPDRESIQGELLAAGFRRGKSSKPLNGWIVWWIAQALPLPVNPSSCRIYVDRNWIGWMWNAGAFCCFWNRAAFLIRDPRTGD
jgi:Smg protein